MFGEKYEFVSEMQYYKDWATLLMIPEDIVNKQKNAQFLLNERKRIIETNRIKSKENLQTYDNSKNDKKNKLIYFYESYLKDLDKAENNLKAEKEILAKAFNIDVLGIGSIHWTNMDIPRLWDEKDYVLMTKFLEMPAGDYRYLKKEYKTNGPQSSSFVATIQQYIANYKVLDCCKSIVNNNKFVSHKCAKDLLQKVLEYYEKDSYAFCLAAVSNIEGLFSAYCLDSGVSEEFLLAKAISEKAAKLFEHGLLHSFDVAYYTYFFPILRNRLMHGTTLDSDWNTRANLIMLDFYNALKISESSTLHYNVIEKNLMNISEGYSYLEMLKFCALHEFFEKNVRDSIMKKYETQFLADITARISKGKKVPNCCIQFAKSLDLVKQKEERKMIFGNSEKEIDDVWTFCTNIEYREKNRFDSN